MNPKVTVNILRHVLLPLALVAAPCAGQSVKVYDLGASAAQQADAYINTDRPKAVRASKRIVIPYFQLEFPQQSSASALAFGNSEIKTTVTLKGVTKAQFQSITDDFYDAVVADLKAAGFEVVSLEDMRASAEFQALSNHGFKDSPALVEHFDNISHFYAPHAMRVYFLPGDERFIGVATSNKSKPSLLGGFSAFGSAMKGAIGERQDRYPDEEKALAKALGALALRVRVVVDFADVSAAVHAGEAQSKSPVRISFASKYSFYQFIGADGEADFVLRQPLISGEGFAEKKDTGRNGGGGKNFVAVADGAAYEASVRKHLEAFRAMVMERVKGSR